MQPKQLYSVQELTYREGRVCKHCDTPIADQEHKLRTHCERVVHDDGSIGSCKDDRNADKRKEADEPYRKLVAFQKKQTAQLDNLLATYGTCVTVEQLNQYGVQLDKALGLQKEEGLLIFLFLYHRLKQQRDQTFTIKRESYVL
ncbi:hypothetical protein HRG84_24090 [Flavisolibacter sp. BT320]|nr:hypothetical protein [Flavisolibacter longurius]